MTDLIPFDYSGRQVRTVAVDGEPWFIAADVCSVLGIKDVSDVVARIDQADRDRIPVRSGNQNRQTWVVNESGLYDLIIRSDKPEAKPFRRWITAEVIPSIRRTGSYGAPGLPDLTTAAGVLALAEQLAVTARQLVEAEQFREEIEGGDGLTLTEFHKKYFSLVRESDFFAFLYGKKYLINQRNTHWDKEKKEPRDGPEHRHPAAKGKPFLYLHNGGVHGGKRRERTRVRPGEPELLFRDALTRDGLPPNRDPNGQLALGDDAA